MKICVLPGDGIGPEIMAQAVRVLIHVNTDKTASEIKHVYLKGAVQLRPEWGYSAEQVAELLTTAATT